MGCTQAVTIASVESQSNSGGQQVDPDGSAISADAGAGQGIALYPEAGHGGGDGNAGDPCIDGCVDGARLCDGDECRPLQECHDTCDLSCDPVQGGMCGLDCTGASDCNATCGGVGTCVVDCRNATRCDLICPSNASCVFACGGTSDCRASCAPNSICEVDCRDGAGCEHIACAPGAACTMLCDTGLPCNFEQCPSGGIACAGDPPTSVCNTECP